MPRAPVNGFMDESHCRVYILVSNCGLEDWQKQHSFISILQNMKHEMVSG